MIHISVILHTPTHREVKLKEDTGRAGEERVMVH